MPSDLSRIGLACLLLLTALLAGCGNPEGNRLMARTIAPSSPEQIAGEYRVFLATTRARSDLPGHVFSGDRNAEGTYGFVDVSVPAIHKAGTIERPIPPEVADPARYLAARRLALFNSTSAFKSELEKSIRANGGQVMVFIHGYNTAFDYSVYRMAQIAHDSGFKGTFILFTWPSGGSVVDYLYDHNSATMSRDALERMLLTVADANPKRIDIVAHSMGSWLTMEAMRQLALTGKKSLNGRLHDIVLASPDIDLDVFKTQLERYGKPTGNFFLLTAQNDRALRVSGLLAGRQERVGAALDAASLAQYGLIVIDTTEIASADRLNHTKFAENPALVKLLGETLTQDINAKDSNELTGLLRDLGNGLGRTVGSAASIVVTTPFRVIDLLAQ